MTETKMHSFFRQGVDFNVTIFFQRLITRKRCKIQRRTDRQSCMIYQMVPFSMTSNDAYITQISRVRHYLTLNISKTIRQTHRYYRSLIQSDMWTTDYCDVANDLERRSRSFEVFSLKVRVTCFSGLWLFPSLPFLPPSPFLFPYPFLPLPFPLSFPSLPSP